MKNMTDSNRRELYNNFASNPHTIVSPSASAPSLDVAQNELVQQSQKMQQFLAGVIVKQDTSPSYPPSAGSTAEAYPVNTDGHFAEPVYAQAFPSSSSSTYHSTRHDEPQTIRVVHHHHNRSNDNFWLWMYLLNHSNSAPAAPAQRSDSTSNKSNSKSDFAAMMYVLIIALAVAGPALFAAYYLLSEVWHNIERLYYNEGYLQATLGFMSVIASLTLSTALTNAALNPFITALCVSAGLSNPLAWAFFILFSMTLVGAAGCNLLFQEGIYASTAAFHKADALEPEQPGRFSISAEQVKYLPKNTNIDKVQTVITAIHHDMKPAGRLRYSPFFRDADTSEKLKAIRTLRTEGQVDYETTLGEELNEYGNSSELTLNFRTAHLK